MKFTRVGITLTTIAFLFLILTGCSPIVELPIEEPVPLDPIDKLTEKLQLTDEQLQTLEAGTGTLEFQEEQVDIYREPVKELLNEAEQLFDEPRRQQVENILDRLLKGEADLQGLKRLAEDLFEMRGTAPVQVVTNLRKISDEVEHSASASTGTIVYTPIGSNKGDRNFSTPAMTWCEKIGTGEPNCVAARGNPKTGGLSTAVYSWVGSDRATALLTIRIPVPADNSDVNITATMKYASAGITAGFGGATTTSIATYGGTQFDPRYKVLDPIFGWSELGNAICDAVSVVQPEATFACMGIESLDIIVGTFSHLELVDLLQNIEDAEEHKIHYNPGTLDKGTYVFSIGFHARSGAPVIAIAEAGLLGQITKIEVSLPTPPTATINSPSDGSSFTEGETINFQGSATDPEDGNLMGNSLVWTSDIDGQIGTGESFSKSNLSVGTHTITLTATDSEGLKGTDSVTINVVKKPDLIVSSVSLSKSSAQVGDIISVTFTVENNGGPVSKEFENRVFLSTTQYGGNGTQIPIQDFPMTLNGTASKTETVDVTIPQVPEGGWWMAVYTDCDEIIDESEEGNNIDSAEITIEEGENRPPTAAFDASPTSGKAPLEVSFDASDSSDPDGSITYYEWEFGDGATGSGETTSHTYDSTGNYTAQLTVTDNDGASDSTAVEISVSSPTNQNPTASFTADPTSGEAPLDVSFDASDSSDPDGNITDYAWDFGDGNTGNGETSTHTYNNEGTYTATLTVTDDDGATDQSQVTITVTSPTEDSDDIPGRKLSMGDTVSGTVNAETDPNDVFAVQLEAGKQIKISIVEEHQKGEVLVHLLSPDSQSIKEERFTFVLSRLNAELWNFPNTTTYTPAKSGTYYIWVQATDGNIAYELSVARTSEVYDAPEADDIPGAPINFGAYKGVVDEVTDPNDVFAVQLEAGKQIKISITGESPSWGGYVITEGYLWLLPPDTQSIKDIELYLRGVEFWGTSSVTITYTPATTGIYYIWVQASGKIIACMAYELSVARTPEG